MLYGTDVGYDGVYNRQPNTINNFDWWQSRDDVGGIGANQRARLYYYTGMNGSRWRLEGPGASFWSPAWSWSDHSGTWW